MVLHFGNLQSSYSCLQSQCELKAGNYYFLVPANSFRVLHTPLRSSLGKGRTFSLSLKSINGTCLKTYLMPLCFTTGRGGGREGGVEAFKTNAHTPIPAHLCDARSATPSHKKGNSSKHLKVLGAS